MLCEPGPQALVRAVRVVVDAELGALFESSFFSRWLFLNSGRFVRWTLFLFLFSVSCCFPTSRLAFKESHVESNALPVAV